MPERGILPVLGKLLFLNCMVKNSEFAVWEHTEMVLPVFSTHWPLLKLVLGKLLDLFSVKFAPTFGILISLFWVLAYSPVRS